LSLVNVDKSERPQDIEVVDVHRFYIDEDPSTFIHDRGVFMLNWALTFLIVALIAGVLGFSGIAGAAANIAWILFVVGLVLAVVFFLAGRRPVS